MITTITTAVTGILSAIGTLINPVLGEGTGSEAAYTAVLALPILGGVVAMARRLIKKSR